MSFSKINIKKILFSLVVIFLAAYFFWDISLKIINKIRWQGYAIAINGIIREAENPECRPFNVFSGEKQIQLINVNCLQIQPLPTEAQPEGNPSE